LAENRLPGNDLYRFAIKRLPGRLKSYLGDYDLLDRVSEAYPANVQLLAPGFTIPASVRRPNWQGGCILAVA
jgi:hypothetical protein